MDRLDHASNLQHCHTCLPIPGMRGAGGWKGGPEEAGEQQSSPEFHGSHLPHALTPQNSISINLFLVKESLVGRRVEDPQQNMSPNGERQQTAFP